MTARINHLLDCWFARRDAEQWVLASIVGTEGSAYRKAGAMMLINGCGETFGVLSGGCLEGDIARQAHKALVTQQALLVTYDFAPDSAIPWQRGIGCGGAVHVLLQTITADTGYLGLDTVHEAFARGQSVSYQQRLSPPGLTPDCWRVVPLDRLGALTANSRSSSAWSTTPSPSTTSVFPDWCCTPLHPRPHLLILGGGADARPLSLLAQTIGWRVSVVDQRNGYARTEDFPGAAVYSASAARGGLASVASTLRPCAIVIMHHNLTLDAEALRFASTSSALYIGLLGPAHRRAEVEQLAAVNADTVAAYYAGPAGLDIGAQLPETIALAILAECHWAVEGRQGETRASAGESPLKNAPLQAPSETLARFNHAETMASSVSVKQKTGAG